MKHLIKVYSIIKNGWRLTLCLTFGVIVSIMALIPTGDINDQLDSSFLSYGLTLPELAGTLKIEDGRLVTQEESTPIGDDGEASDSYVDFGNPDSEQIHTLESNNTEIGYGGLEQPYRRIIPKKDEKGWIAFDTDVSPDEQNYITLRIWGSDDTTGSLFLYTDKENISLGNIWDFGVGEEPFPGRWIYRTFPIPPEVTEEKTELRLRIESQRPTFAVYNGYVHTEPYFKIPEGEQQGESFEWGPVREKPENFPSIEQRFKERAFSYIENMMNQNVVGSEFGTDHRRLTRALHAQAYIYHTEWSDYYQDERIPGRVRDAIDVHVKRQAGYGGEPGKMFYRAWMSHGRIADAFCLLKEKFEKRGWLDEYITLEGPDGDRTVTRREAYGDFFHNTFEWRRKDRRHFTNQPNHISMTLYGTQDALRKLGDERALTKEQALWYVHEAIGLEPLRSREFGIHGDAAGFPFYSVTPKGLSREIGYTHAYGDESGSMIDRYRRTGSEKIKEQVARYVDTRSYFRIPANDDNGYRTLRDIGFMGWRGTRYPGDLSGYNGIQQAAALEDPAAIRLGQLKREHGRLYSMGAEGPSAPTHNELDPIRDYEDYRKLMEMPPTDHRLAMEPEHGDFVFGDEQVATYAFRHGENRVYGTFFLGPPTRSGAVWNYGRLRFTQPNKDRLADVHFESQFPSSEMFIEIDHPWGTRKYEQTPPPPGMKEWSEWPPNAIDRRSGLAYFYRLHYGDYLIGMNTTQKGTYRESTYELEIPEGIKQVVNVDTGELMNPNEPVEIGPATTIVLYLEEG